MPNLLDIALDNVNVPDYDFQEFLDQCDPEATKYRIGSTFGNEPFDRSPGEIKVSRPVREILHE